MAEFAYKGKDSKGQAKSGKLRARDKGDAKRQLERMRLKSVTVEAIKAGKAKNSYGVAEEKEGLIGRDAKGNLVLNIGNQNPSDKDLIVFTKQFATMISSGVPLIQALTLLAAQQRLPAFGKKLDKIRNTVENGATLSEAMEQYPKVFDTLFISMVRAGEVSGKLDIILMKLVTYIEKSGKIKSQVRSAMMYPAIVVVVAGTVVTGLLVFVVPTFSKQFADSGKELPGLTQMVLDLSNFFVDYWYIIVSIVLGGIFGLKAYIKTLPGRIVYDRLILKVPGIGMLLNKVAVGRFCSTMATMLTSGVNMLEALTICAASSGNKTIESFILGVRSGIEQGQKFSEPLGEGTLFPGMVVSMVSVGEATGALDDMLMKVSEFYEDEVDMAVKTVLSMIEPILIVGIGTIVGTVVIAMYLPVFDMGGLTG